MARLQSYNNFIWALVGTLMLIGIIVGIVGTGFSYFQMSEREGKGLKIKASAEEEAGKLPPSLTFCMPNHLKDSDWLLIPVGLRDHNKSERSLFSGSGYKSWKEDPCGWSGQLNNIVFQSLSNRGDHLLFEEKAVIWNYKLDIWHQGEGEDKAGKPKKRFKKKPVLHLWEIGQNDSNGDGTINAEDTSALYISLADGKGLMKLTPGNVRVIDFNFHHDLGLLFIRVRKDTDLNGSYTDEDEQELLKVDINRAEIGKAAVGKEIRKQLDGMLLK